MGNYYTPILFSYLRQDCVGINGLPPLNNGIFSCVVTTVQAGKIPIIVSLTHSLILSTHSLTHSTLSMGSGASTQNLEALELKDELLSLPEVQNIYGDQFDEYIFNTLKDENSLVKKSDLKNIVDIQTKLFNTTLTKATFDVFKHYSGNTGEMKTRSFLDLCRDAKILKKAKFSSADASILYDKVLKKQRVIAKSLNYEMFRKDIVPAIAAKYDISDDDVLSKFGGVGLPSEEIFDESVREKEDTGEVTEQQSKAATKLQSITRQKSAAKEMEEMKKVSFEFIS